MSHNIRQTPSAVVVGIDNPTGLQTARILAQHGVSVTGVADDMSHFCCRTRVCSSKVQADTDSPSLIEALMTLDISEGAALFPCTDASVLTLSANRERLQGRFAYALPSHQVVAQLLNKDLFFDLAKRRDVPVPETRRLYNMEDALQAAASLTFPCALKPTYKTARWLEQTSAKVYKVKDPQSFLELYEQCEPWSEAMLVQEWIEGSDVNLCSCYCYYGKDSTPLVTFTSRKIRQWPPGVGTGCLGEECEDEEVRDLTLRLFNSLEFHGFGSLEVKRDDRTGRCLAIEPSVGRPTGRSSIAEAGGVDLIYTQYCDLVGLPLPSNRTQQFTGAKWISTRRDFQSAFHAWRRGQLSLGQWWRSRRGRKRRAVFSWRDPLPFVFDLARVFRLLLTGGARPRSRKNDNHAATKRKSV